MTFPLISVTALVGMHELGEQAGHLQAKKGHTTDIEARCIYDVSRKNDYGDDSAKGKLSRAYAICRSSLQKSGRMKKGTADLTKLGKKRNVAKAKRKDHETKFAGFERLVKAARKE